MFFHHSKRVRIYTRITSFLCLCCFTFTTLAWSAPPLPSPEVRLPAPLAQEIHIPEPLGLVREIYVPENNASSAPVILHLQDAHGSAEAQDNIRRILSHAAAQYGFDLVFVEGASERIDAENLIFFRAPSSARKAGEGLAREGLIGGAELFLLDRLLDKKGPAVEAYGIEDPALYRANLSSFRGILKKRDASREISRRLKSQILTRSSKTFNPRLKSFFRHWALYRDEPQEWMRRRAFLQKTAREVLGLDLLAPRAQLVWPQITRFLKLAALEEKTRNETAVEEIRELADWARKRGMPRDLIAELEAMTEKTKDAPRDARAPRAFFEAWVNAAGKDFSFDLYPEFKKWAGCRVLESELHAGALFEELEALTSQILHALAGNAEEKALLDLYGDARLLEKLLLLQLTEPEWREAASRREQIRPSALARRAGLEDAGHDEIFDGALVFYAQAKQREQALLRNMIAKMKETKKTKAVLITGGFHAPGLDALFREKGISFVEAAPHISEITPEGTYEKIMLDEAEFLTLRSHVSQPHLGEGLAVLARSLGRPWAYEYSRSLNRVLGGVLHEDHLSTADAWAGGLGRNGLTYRGGLLYFGGSPVPDPAQAGAFVGLQENGVPETRPLLSELRTAPEAAQVESAKDDLENFLEDEFKPLGISFRNEFDRIGRVQNAERHVPYLQASLKRFTPGGPEAEGRRGVYMAEAHPTFYFRVGAWRFVDSRFKGVLGPLLDGRFRQYKESVIYLHEMDSSIADWENNLTNYTVPMIAAVDSLELNGRNVLDMGSADGILALLAYRKGADLLRLVDNDPAKRALLEKNLALNGMDPSRFRFVVEDINETGEVLKGLGPEPVHVVFSNIGEHPRVYRRGTHLKAIEYLDHFPDATHYVLGGYNVGATRITEPHLLFAVDALERRHFYEADEFKHEDTNPLLSPGGPRVVLVMQKMQAFEKPEPAPRAALRPATAASERLRDFTYDPSLGRDLRVAVVVKGTNQLERNAVFLARRLGGAKIDGSTTSREPLHGLVSLTDLNRDALTLEGAQQNLLLDDPNGFDVHGTRAVITSWNKVIVQDFVTGAMQVFRNPWFRHLHSAVFSPDGTKILVDSAGLDMLLEIDAKTGEVLWEWSAWEHGYPESFSGEIFYTRDRAFENVKIKDGKKVVYVSDPAALPEIGIPTGLRTANITGADYDRDGNILATLLYRGKLIRIDKQTKEARELPYPAEAAHGFHALPGGFMVTSTTGKDPHFAFLGPDLRVQTKISLDGLPGIREGFPEAPEMEWLQNTTQVAPHIFALVDIHRKALYLVNFETHAYRRLDLPKEWSVHMVAPAPAALRLPEQDAFPEDARHAEMRPEMRFSYSKV
ncbi:MAG TPA: 50S ribosomal protein L11 methyltransferase, partial [Verrucomicrobiae bacterium]|nr:50S ribosomal protein L11 methyltransferase [Verrucomicrobiae bacterium]